MKATVFHSAGDQCANNTSKELANHLPQLEEHEAQLVERTQAIETRRIELEKAAELGAKRSDIDVRYASIRERETYINNRLLEIESDSKVIQPNGTKLKLAEQYLKTVEACTFPAIYSFSKGTYP
ncbi:MAG: hypothetical protein CM15mP49_27790 [Actinomycetota bacterium]|nr:MAG: hypothetical protein CM15mP49_27790 [Actinomycetota bacterium]